MDRLKREGNPPAGQLASPTPQYKDVDIDDWAELQGEGGASYVKDKDAIAKLEQVRVLLAGVATEAKLEQARALLSTISLKDFATDTELKALKTELGLVKAELQTIKTNQTSGDQKVQLSGTMMELYGATIDNRPLASSVTVGATYMAVDTQEVWQSNGTDWVVM